MRSTAPCFDELRAYIEDVPLVDCHDHSSACSPKHTDPLWAVVTGYFGSDIQSASSEADLEVIHDADRSLEERWPVFERVWKRTCHTGYAQVTRRVMARFYGESEMSLEALQRMTDKFQDFEDPEAYEGVLEEARIAVRLTNFFENTEGFLDGTYSLPPRAVGVIPLPQYHGVCNRGQMNACMAPLERTVNSLDAYLDGCLAVFKRFKDAGAVAFKDQCAYSRTLAFGNPSRAEAEAVFNWFMDDPRRSASYPDGVKPLDDYLFHAFMRMARDLDLPVQIHTGHMAGIRNDIAKTNAVLLTSVLELHPDVQFDLFHANWPYSGELVFLAKNYPNVAMDFCWANIIDPVYCQDLFRQALAAVPHGKVHAYGSDFGGNVDRAWAHASIARDNVAVALADMVAMEYLGLDDAKEVARAWMFDNANAFFRLGL